MESVDSTAAKSIVISLASTPLVGNLQLAANDRRLPLMLMSPSWHFFKKSASIASRSSTLVRNLGSPQIFFVPSFGKYGGKSSSDIAAPSVATETKLMVSDQLPANGTLSGKSAAAPQDASNAASVKTAYFVPRIFPIPIR
jgi:hypothetical protein